MLFSSDIWCGVAQCFEVYLIKSSVTSCQGMALLSTQGAGQSHRNTKNGLAKERKK